MTERKRLHLDVYDMEALKAKYPKAVKQVVIVKEDHTELYKYARAHVVTGEAIPGVIITKPDGTSLGTKEAVAAENVTAAKSEDYLTV